MNLKTWFAWMALYFAVAKLVVRLLDFCSKAIDLGQVFVGQEANPLRHPMLCHPLMR